MRIEHRNCRVLRNMLRLAWRRRGRNMVGVRTRRLSTIWMRGDSGNWLVLFILRCFFNKLRQKSTNATPSCPTSPAPNKSPPSWPCPAVKRAPHHPKSAWNLRLLILPWRSNKNRKIVRWKKCMSCDFLKRRSWTKWSRILWRKTS